MYSVLGLATVYGIVKQNHGYISVYSELDTGTTIKVYLPRQEGTVDLKQTGLKAAIAYGNETILLVEDNSNIRETVRLMLESYGYSVLVASTFVEALEHVQTNKEIRLLISDVIMPGMNGSELVKRLGDFNPGMKCLFISGYTADLIAHNGVLDGSTHFLQKPFTTKDLADKVREVLDGD